MRRGWGAELNHLFTTAFGNRDGRMSFAFGLADPAMYHLGLRYLVGTAGFEPATP